MHNNEIVAIIVPTCNSVDKISSTIESVIKQNFSKDKIRIVAIDNFSNDGTYEKLLDFTKKNKEIMSIYRLSEATKPTCVLKKIVHLLKDVPIAYSAILKPGDKIYPNFVSECVSTFENIKNFKGRLLLCETDLVDKLGKTIEQKPIYTENCILKGNLHYEEYIASHIDHRIQAFYKGLPIFKSAQLDEILHIIDYTDWFNKICYFSYNNLYSESSIYLKNKLAAINEEGLDNPIHILMQKLFILERTYCVIDCMPTVSMIGKIDEKNRKKSFKCLAILALKYAIQQIKKGNNQIAYNCLVFAEMVYLDIVKDQMYVDIKSVLNSNDLEYKLLKYEQQEESVQIPEGSYSF